MAFETETIDRLFLELSQFTKASTAKEMALVAALQRIADHGGYESAFIAKKALSRYRDGKQPNG